MKPSVVEWLSRHRSTGLKQLRILGAPAMGSEIHIYRRPEDRELLLSGLRLAAGDTI
jgi:hypothetical protein